MHHVRESLYSNASVTKLAVPVIGTLLDLLRQVLAQKRKRSDAARKTASRDRRTRPGGSANCTGPLRAGAAARLRTGWQPRSGSWRRAQRSPAPKGRSVSRRRPGNGP
nr:hypothetical protein KitaXyl93_23320 [Kitasatospora sp. Xyl93]